jgi:hypothetical protein
MQGTALAAAITKSLATYPSQVASKTCVYAATYPEMLALSRQIIERADKHNVSFNAKKTVGAFAVEEGDFAGYRLNSKGYSPSPELTRAIREFPRPADKTDLRSFNGLCQQVGLFSDKIAEALAPFSPLLKKQAAFTWLPDHDEAFNRPGRITIRNDRAGMPRGGLGHEKMQEFPRRPPNIRSRAGPPAINPDSQRLLTGPTG